MVNGLAKTMGSQSLKDVALLSVKTGSGYWGSSKIASGSMALLRLLSTSTDLSLQSSILREQDLVGLSISQDMSTGTTAWWSRVSLKMAGWWAPLKTNTMQVFCEEIAAVAHLIRMGAGWPKVLENTIQRKMSSSVEAFRLTIKKILQ